MWRMIAGMAKRSKPTEPGADAIDAEEVLGKEEPDQAEPRETPPVETGQQSPGRRPPQGLPRLPNSIACSSVGVVVLTVGVADYVFRNELAEQYERRFHPERYWAREVKRQAFQVEFVELMHQECMVDLLAARMKDSIGGEARADRHQLERRAHLGR
jgi:hypothetical protein